MLEKRLFLRLKLNSQAVLKIDNNQLDGIVVDLSENGFSFLSNQYVDLNKASVVELVVNLKGSPVRILAQPKWVEKISDKYRYGLRYLSDKDKEGKYRELVRGLC